MLLKRALDFLLYTHIYIGCCALLLCWGSFVLFGGAQAQWAFTVFAFCGTIWVYNLHRTVGLGLSDTEDWPDRFRLFYQLRNINAIIALITSIVAIYIFFAHLLSYWLYLLPPIGVSLLYVFPLSTKKLVRSIPYLKIFLIAFTWAWVTLVFPAVMSGLDLGKLVLLLFMERFLFIMAIDIPFDIRDYEQDAHQSVDTLVHHLGIKGSKRLGIGLLMICIILSVTSILTFQMAWIYALLHLPVYVLSMILIAYTHKGRNDRFYTFGLDGMMLLMGMMEVSFLWWIS